MKQLWKRNLVAALALSLVVCAIYLNGKYTAKVEEADKILGESALVDAPVQEEQAQEMLSESGADYFASARLTRRHARDNAISLLQEASGGAGVDAQTAAEAAQSIQTLASYTLKESQIENMITAKGYADCVVFLSDDSVSVVVAAQEDGLQTEDVARLTDIVKGETGCSAECIKILEVN